MVCLRAGRGAIVVAALLTIIVLAAWGPRGARTAHACAFDDLPLTYESLTYAQDYAYIMELAGYDLLFPGDNEFGRQALNQGPRNARGTGSGYIPPALIKAIAFMESGWQMAGSTVPYGGTGNTLASGNGDCGYGIMQVTSGMTAPLGSEGAASPVQALIATHYAYNIARGTAILANKWNEGATTRPIVATADPHVLEDWYYAVWGYNGFASVNHPLAERYANPARPAYSCNPNDGFGHDRSQYPYQELVFGCAKNPPIRAGGPLWTPQPLGLPNLFDPAVLAALNLANFVYPYTKMDLYSPNAPAPAPAPLPSDPTTPSLAAIVIDGPARLRAGPSTKTDILGAANTGALLTVVGRNADSTWAQVRTDSGGNAWVLASLLSIQGALSALPDATSASPSPPPAPTPTSGSTNPFGGTPSTPVFTIDGSSPPSLARRQQLLGVPSVQFESTPVDVTIATSEVAPNAQAVTTIRNTGTGIGTWMVVSSRKWLTPLPLAGVAIAPDVGCKTETTFCDRQVSVRLRVDASGLTQGENIAELRFFTPLLPGQVTVVPVRIFVGPVVKTETVARTLVPGCNPMGVASPDGTAIEAFAARIQPAGAITAIWRLTTAQSAWELYFPGQPAVSTLKTVNSNDALFICTNAPAALTQEVALAGEGRLTQLLPGCTFVGIGKDTPASTLAGAIQPPTAVTILWKYDPEVNGWLLFLPTAPFSSTLTNLARTDGVFICVNAAAILPGVTLAPAEVGQISTPTPTQANQAQLVATVIDGPARIRALPTTDSATIDLAATGDALLVVGRNADVSWAQVKTEASTGWVLASLLGIQGNLVTLPATAP